MLGFMVTVYEFRTRHVPRINERGDCQFQLGSPTYLKFIKARVE